MRQTRATFARESDQGTSGSRYAAAQDFCAIFRQETDSLYSLALLLAADEAKAESIFAGALEDCMKGFAVFKAWARSRARRAIVKRAIAGSSLTAGVPAAVPGVKGVMRGAMRAVLQLAAFDRFAFVMTVLESYSDRESALLLDSSSQDVAAARSRALQSIARAGENLMPLWLEARGQLVGGAA
jgi:DNA-directed RNA polymerase specialized sigma24 family protein